MFDARARCRVFRRRHRWTAAAPRRGSLALLGLQCPQRWIGSKSVSTSETRERQQVLVSVVRA